MSRGEKKKKHRKLNEYSLSSVNQTTASVIQADVDVLYSWHNWSAEKKKKNEKFRKYFSILKEEIENQQSSDWHSRNLQMIMMCCSQRCFPRSVDFWKVNILSGGPSKLSLISVFYKCYLMKVLLLNIRFIIIKELSHVALYLSLLT